MATVAELTAELNELKASRTQMLTGQWVESATHKERAVRYGKADQSLLDSAILNLERQIAAAESSSTTGAGRARRIGFL